MKEWKVCRHKNITLVRQQFDVDIWERRQPLTQNTLWSTEVTFYVLRRNGIFFYNAERSHSLHLSSLSAGETISSFSTPPPTYLQYPPLVLTLLSSHISPGTEQCSSISSVSVSVSLDGIFIVSILKWYWTYLSLTPSLSRSLAPSHLVPTLLSFKAVICH